jgi:hypothetical protein
MIEKFIDKLSNTGEQCRQIDSVSLKDLARSIERVFVKLNAYKAALLSANIVLNKSDKDSLLSDISAILTRHEALTRGITGRMRSLQSEEYGKALLEAKALLSANLSEWNRLILDFNSLLCREKGGLEAMDPDTPAPILTRYVTKSATSKLKENDEEAGDEEEKEEKAT